MATGSWTKGKDTVVVLAADAGWNEGDHPRGEGGQFGSGGGGSGGSGGEMSYAEKRAAQHASGNYGPGGELKGHTGEYGKGENPHMLGSGAHQKHEDAAKVLKRLGGASQGKTLTRLGSSRKTETRREVRVQKNGEIAVKVGSKWKQAFVGPGGLGLIQTTPHDATDK